MLNAWCEWVNAWRVAFMEARVIQSCESSDEFKPNNKTRTRTHTKKSQRPCVKRQAKF